MTPISLTPKNLSISAFLLHEEAQKRGIECTIMEKHAILMKKGDKTWYTRGSRTSLQSSVGKSIADNKALTKVILEHFQIPTAAYQVIKTAEELSALQQLQYPLVMKPIDGNQGEGVVVGISDAQEAVDAFVEYQAAEKKSVIFEEMLSGTEYRILCVDYQFLAAIYRKPAFVTGDGKKTIEELIVEKNQHPWRGEHHSTPLSLIKVDKLVLNYLQKQGYTLETVLDEGQEASLRKTSNLSTGGEPWNVTDQVCEENKTLFEQIARVCDLNTIGIDVMCHDLGTPLPEQPQAGIIEVNASPGLRMHHFPLQGSALNAAGKILDMVERRYGLHTT